MLHTNEPVRTDPRRMSVLEIKENQKQTTPIEISVAARDVFKQEDDYKEYLTLLKMELGTLKAKYNKVLHSLEEEFPREQRDDMIIDEEDEEHHLRHQLSMRLRKQRV